MGDVVYAAFELVCNFSLPLSESTAEHLPGVFWCMHMEHGNIPLMDGVQRRLTERTRVRHIRCRSTE